MTKWKVDDIIGLRVDSADSNAVRVLVGWKGTMPITASVSPAFIEPIPRPMTDAEAELVDAALKYNDAPSESKEEAYAEIKLFEATVAVEAERAPPDSFEKLKAIVRADSHPKTILAAIARLEAKLKEPKQ